MSESSGSVFEQMLGSDGEIRSPQEVAYGEFARQTLDSCVRSIDEVGDYLPEEDDPNVLVYGPWLERGGSAFWVSTAGTGKSIAATQLAHCWGAGKPFCGLRPRGCLRSWVFQSEDSPRRVVQDRIDVRAELAELHPSVDWPSVGREMVKSVKLSGKVGVLFLDELDRLLTFAEGEGEAPDYIILNPFLAFVGGPITDGSYVTPFLRGGIVEGLKTCGLQDILERHHVGVLIFHHTPKPPSDKDLDAWMKSAFPEYQGAGSSDITNWGRSFVTMMRVKNHANMVCVTAGKNGAELGWERVGGAVRRYMAYSSELGVSGKGRHAWRDLTEEEYAEVVGTQRADEEKKVDEAVDAIVDAIKRAKTAPTAGRRGIEPLMSGMGFCRTALRAAISKVIANAHEYGLTIKPVLHATGRFENHIGQAENLRAAASKNAEEGKYAKRMEEYQESVKTEPKPENVDPVEPIIATKETQSPVETPREEPESDEFPFN